MGRTQTTESTGKLWKLIQMVGVVGILAGATWFMVGYAGDDGNASAGGMVLGVLAAPVWVFGRVGAWWFHG